MPKSKGKSSAQGESARTSHFVLDFLYHDSRRIGSFLSQFDPGFLQNLTQTDEVHDHEAERHGRSFALGAPKVLGGANESGEEVGSGTKNTLQRVFDPYWTNARTFLDRLNERDMLQRDIAAAQIGQFVLAKGWLSVLDLAMFKDAWKLPTLQRKVKEGAVPTKKIANTTASEKTAYLEHKNNADMMLEMLQIMPHSVYSSMVTSDDSPKLVWCTLANEYLVTTASDIVLAHGNMMPGEWSVMGILNAQPEYVAPDPSIDTDLAPGLTQSVVGQMSKMIAPVVRLALGRPAAAYAITPLLIYREVN